jgi:hypothetical protein
VEKEGMQIPVLLEMLSANGYRATSLTPTKISAEASSRDEALQQVSRLVQEQFAHAEIIQLNVPLPGESHPWQSLAGTWKNHPDGKEFEHNLREYRRQVDADPDRL